MKPDTCVAFAAVLALALLASPILAAEPIAGIASVIDADTIELHGERIRLVGIDAPEGRQTCELDGKPWRCGQPAAFALAKHLGKATLAPAARRFNRQLLPIARKA